VYSFDDIKKYRTKYGKVGLLIDTNILHLLLIGIYNKDYICECELVKSKYTAEDFDILLELISHFKPEIIITPSILAEISNQAKIKVKSPHFHIYLTKFLDKLRGFKELHFPLEKVLSLNFRTIHDFGFTDISLVEIAKENNLVILTDEVNLHSYFHTQIPIIKFSHIKSDRLGIIV